MLLPGIPSRPVYGKLAPRPGKAHLFVADADGVAAILDMAPAAPEGFFGTATIIYVPGEHAAQIHRQRLSSLHSRELYEGVGVAEILPVASDCLSKACMGLQLYLAGAEGLIGQVMRLAMDHGINHTTIVTEHRGTTARRVQCVHCKGITENVTTQPVRCSICGLTLLVRDHYSRRIAAFQGVCIDAEAPGSAPPMQEIFL